MNKFNGALLIFNYLIEKLIYHIAFDYRCLRKKKNNENIIWILYEQFVPFVLIIYAPIIIFKIPIRINGIHWIFVFFV